MPQFTVEATKGGKPVTLRITAESEQAAAEKAMMDGCNVLTVALSGPSEPLPIPANAPALTIETDAGIEPVATAFQRIGAASSLLMLTRIELQLRITAAESASNVRTAVLFASLFVIPWITNTVAHATYDPLIEAGDKQWRGHIVEMTGLSFGLMFLLAVIVSIYFAVKLTKMRKRLKSLVPHPKWEEVLRVKLGS